ncbi:Uncharacterised protein [Shigella sonnei]|nr:Uncharacterised protein [Shigella sonnei]
MVLTAGDHHSDWRVAFQFAITFILLWRQALFDPFQVIGRASVGQFGGIVHVLTHPAVEH